MGRQLVGHFHPWVPDVLSRAPAGRQSSQSFHLPPRSKKSASHCKSYCPVGGERAGRSRVRLYSIGGTRPPVRAFAHRRKRAYRGLTWSKHGEAEVTP